jgi:hypothetical protein
MALEVRYVPMMDEADNIPKIFRVVYNESGDFLASSIADYKEAAIASPSCIEIYFDLLSTYFKNMSTFIDSQTQFNREVYFKMSDLRGFTNYFFNNYDFDILNDE